ncbi:MAG: glucosamine-6-phosphate deaminase [Bacilli bacterium]|nr:glucosamine-6-phosphate deaminase [Bacilli bacterium]
MKIIKVKDYEELSRLASKIVAKCIKNKPDACLGLATGSTPIGMYQNLVKMYKDGKISFEKVKTFNLDEYCVLDKSHPQSYHSYMDEQLFKHINILEENIHIPDGNTNNHQEACQNYNQLLNDNIIDLQILGIGGNGHIGFNEPNTPCNQETFIVKLAEKTRLDNQRFFASLEEVPLYAITMGIKNIFAASKILLLASGKSKAEAIERLINGEVSEEFPASILKKHPNVTIVIDKEAASLLTKRK